MAPFTPGAQRVTARGAALTPEVQVAETAHGVADKALDDFWRSLTSARLREPGPERQR